MYIQVQYTSYTDVYIYRVYIVPVLGMVVVIVASKD